MNRAGNSTVRCARVIAARAAQRRRLGASTATCNADMTSAQLRRLCGLDKGARRALVDAHDRAGLTMRGHDRVMRVARTLADLDESEPVGRRHIAQAVAYRVQEHEQAPIEAVSA